MIWLIISIIIHNQQKTCELQGPANEKEMLIKDYKTKKNQIQHLDLRKI